MTQSSDYPDLEDEAGTRIVFTAEVMLERLAPLVRTCPTAYARLIASFNADDMLSFIKAFRRLSTKCRDEMNVAYAIAIHLLPPPPGMVKTFLRTGPCPCLSSAELERLQTEHSNA